MIFMMITPGWYFVFGIVLILIPMILGFYILHKRQSEVLQVGQEQSQQLRSISEQTALLPNINRQFKTPQYLRQFTVTLNNARSTVLNLSDIIYVSVKDKTLQIHTQKVTYTMEGRLRDVVEGSNPFLPYPLFARVHKSYIVNVLHVNENPADKVFLTLTNAEAIPVKIPLSSTYKTHYMKAFKIRENKYT